MDDFRSRYSTPREPYRGNRPQPTPRSAQPPEPTPTAPAKKTEEPEGKPKKARKKRGYKKWLIIGPVALVVLGAVAAGGYFFIYKKGNHTIIEDPNKKGQEAEKKDTETAKDTAAQLIKYIDLPTDTPILFHVNDVQKLSGNQFFAKAKQGDIVLYYQNAKVAILYRPDTKKVINYSDNATFSSGSDQQNSQSGSSPTQQTPSQ